MFDNIKSAAQKSKKLVQEHKTAAACVVTFGVAWKMSHDFTIAGVIDTTTNLAHELGRRSGANEAYLERAYTFIEDEGLMHKFMGWTPVQSS